MIKDKFQKKFAGFLPKSHLCKSCRRGGPRRQKSPGCSLPRPRLCKTKNLTSPLVFCMDCIFGQLSTGQSRIDSHCDEVVFSDSKGEIWIYCIENKKGKSRNVIPSSAQEQLQGGANVVSARLSKNDNFEFLPVLAAKRGISSSSKEKFFVVCGGKKRYMHILSVEEDANLPTLPLPSL